MAGVARPVTVRSGELRRGKARRCEAIAFQKKHRKEKLFLRKKVQQNILEHLKTHGSISQLEALKLYGSMRLAAVIIRLRERYKIKTIMQTDPTTGSQFARYFYEGEKVN